ncbi:MAG: glycine cleavage system aminomethyltransferase GcvT [Flavobacteriaceae bacterium]|jgi:aminomethyltransferase
MKTKNTPFFNLHTELGAKMASFGGYQMPIQYSGVKQEHLIVRQSIGLFDVSHMGEFLVEGPNAFALLQFICSNDLSKLRTGKAQYNYLPNDQGGVVDDLIVYQLETQKYLLVVNASNIDKDWKHIQFQNEKFQAKISNLSEKTALLAIQGPKTLEAMQSICDADLNSLSNYSHITTTFAGIKNVLVATTGYTGAGGIEIYFEATNAEKIWKTVMDTGSGYGILPVGLAARDTLRLEMGYCLYGNEIDEQTSPISAGLGWVTKTDTQFLNAKSYQKDMQHGTDEKLIGFEAIEKGIPRSGYLLYDLNQNCVGRVTSGTQSPSLNKGIGLGYVKAQLSLPGQKLFVQIRDKFVPVSVVKLPFIN